MDTNKYPVPQIPPVSVPGPRYRILWFRILWYRLLIYGHSRKILKSVEINIKVLTCKFNEILIRMFPEIASPLPIAKFCRKMNNITNNEGYIFFKQ